MSIHGSKKIVIIDDDSDDTAILCRALRSYDKEFECVVFDDPEEAMKALFGTHPSIPDFIFIDINMPKLNGHECLELIRDDSRFDQVVIAIMSTFMPIGAIEAWRQAGAQHAVAKPLTWDRFHDILHKIFDPGN